MNAAITDMQMRRDAAALADANNKELADAKAGK